MSNLHPAPQRQCGELAVRSGALRLCGGIGCRALDPLRVVGADEHIDPWHHEEREHRADRRLTQLGWR